MFRGSGLATRLVFWGVFLAIFTIGAIYALTRLQSLNAEQEATLQHNFNMMLLTERMKTMSDKGLRGDDVALADLSSSVYQFDQSLQQLNGVAPEQLSASVDMVRKNWLPYKDQLERVVNTGPEIKKVLESADSIHNALPQLKQQSNQIVNALSKSANTSTATIMTAMRQLELTERIDYGMSKVLRGDTDALSAVDQFIRDLTEFGKGLSSLQSGGAGDDVSVLELLRKTGLNFSVINEKARQLQQITSQLYSFNQSVSSLPQLAETVSQNTADFERTVNDFYTQRKTWRIISWALGALAIASFVGLVMSWYGFTKHQLEDEQESNENNQRAILRLLDEMSSLAEGDLTVAATVSEDITGAIADSVNFAIEQLRTLVRTINDTAVKVTTAASDTSGVAKQLASASAKQSRQMVSVSSSVTEMSKSIDRVSNNAKDSSTVAKRSVELSQKGVSTVRQTISGMDTIRQQIQETSKRIKRLGESSQEIGNIVSLINDIADQTNILALNAAIQASAAGEAGRGFAVVADEVQRLAERSAGATKQIEVLVKTIQSDTSEAVTSMEASTTQVVEGAKQAEAAGRALAEIENVSSSLAELITDISSEATEQANSSAKIAKTMSAIRDITAQTSAGTTYTAKAINRLSELSGDLQSSVSGFRLPEELIAPQEVAIAEPVFDDDTQMLEAHNLIKSQDGKITKKEAPEKKLAPETKPAIEKKPAAKTKSTVKTRSTKELDLTLEKVPEGKAQKP